MGEDASGDDLFEPFGGPPASAYGQYLVPLALKKYAIIEVETCPEFILCYSCSSYKLDKEVLAFHETRLCQRFA